MSAMLLPYYNANIYFVNEPHRKYEIPSTILIDFLKQSNQNDILENPEEIEDFFLTLTNLSVEIESTNGIVKNFLLDYQQESNENDTS